MTCIHNDITMYLPIKEKSMKQLPVRFNEKQTSQLSTLVDLLGVSTTDLARAAIAIGMQHIADLAEKNKDSAQELVAISAFKAMK